MTEQTTTPKNDQQQQGTPKPPDAPRVPAVFPGEPIEYTDYRQELHPGFVTRVQSPGVATIVVFGIHAGDEASDLLTSVSYNATVEAAHTWRPAPRRR